MTTPARILFPFTAKSIGGSHFSTLNLIRNLDRHKFEPHIVLHRSGLFAEYLRDHGIPHHVVPFRCYASVRRKRSHLVEVARTAPPLTYYIIKNGIDIVHTNDSRTHHSWAMPARLAKKKFIWHLRSNEFRNSNKFIRMAQRADQIVCVSEFIRESLPASLREHSRVIYNPFDIKSEPPDREAARKALLDELGCSQDTAIVGFFANFLERKRPGVFVEAAGRISSRFDRPLVFVMFGEDRTGVSTQLGERAAQLGIGVQLRLMGFRSPVEPLMAGCDVLLIPALDEPFGRTPVEATLVGTPLVAVKSGGHVEYIKDGETGILAEPDDPESIADNALYLLNNPDVGRRMVEQGRRLTVQMLSIGRHVERVSQLYEEILSSRLSAPGVAAPENDVAAE